MAKIDLFQELMDLVRELDRQNLSYGLIGGLALAVHGAPRATMDIDLLVHPDDIEEILAIADQSGFTFSASPIEFKDGTTIHRVTRIQGEESLTLDLMLVSATTQKAWDSIERFKTESGPLRVISRDALIQMKIAAGRKRDIADVEMLRDIDR